MRNFYKKYRESYVLAYFCNCADVISLSKDGSNVRAWHLPDGALVWESLLLPSMGSVASLLVLPVSSHHNYADGERSVSFMNGCFHITVEFIICVVDLIMDIVLIILFDTVT